MERNAHHPDSKGNAPGLEPPAQLSARQRLEWEVSQLADGTLPADRREVVEAALVSDAALRDEYAGHRSVQALLRQSPVPDMDLMAMRQEIMSAIGRQPAYGAVDARRDVAAAGPGLAGLLGSWWQTVTAAAAVLAIGLSAGIVFFGPGGGGAGEIASSTPEISQLEVEGPATILQQSQSSEEQVIALTVTGPDYRAILDPPAEAALPSYTYAYGGSAVIDTPSQIIVASAADE